MTRIGILAFQGDVVEHINAAQAAAAKLKINCAVIEVRTKKDLQELDALIIPGGESTVFYKLCERENMLEVMRNIPAIFGTCAGAIMMAKKIGNAEEGQRSLGLMDIEICRNSYGRQTDSFEEEIDTKLGRINVIFIRAPRITAYGRLVNILAKRNGEAIACEQKSSGKYFLACCFHPEMTTTKFHERFMRAVLDLDLNILSH